MNGCFVYITASDGCEARRLARALVESRLAACANVFDTMTSVYRWEGAVQEDSEAVVIAKTREDLVPTLTEKIKELHSYDCPCVVSLPLTGGSDEFLAWIAAETR